jgi:hypothetical protein
MILVMEQFKKWHGLPIMQSVISGTHISIIKLQGGFVNDYYYHKTWGYSIVAQVIVDHNKKNY